MVYPLPGEKKKRFDPSGESRNLRRFLLAGKAEAGATMGKALMTGEVVFLGLLLLLGLGLIIQGGDLFVASSVRIAEFLEVPRVVIGTTLVSLATTSPELVTSITSGIKQNPGIGVGNAVGSCMCNMCMILGAMAAIRSIGVRLAEIRIPLTAMFAFAVLLLILTWNLRLPQAAGFVLASLGVGYFACDFFHHRRSSRPEDLTEARSIEAESTASGSPWLRDRLRSPKGAGAVFALGAAMVMGGSYLLVDSAENLAEKMGVPPIVIGLTIVAVGTSLPELVTAVKSARQNVADLGVGNILGANVANLTLVIGGAASFKDLSMDRMTQALNFPALIIGMLLVFWMLFSRQRISRREGWLLIAYYFVWLALLTLVMDGSAMNSAKP